MGGGGGDGGYQERADQDAAKKQRGRDAVNAMFGTAPTSAADGPAVDRSKFVTSREIMEGGGDNGYTTRIEEMFDRTGFDQAVAEQSRVGGLGTEAARNKTARDTLYSTVRDNAFTAGRRNLDEASADAKRKTKFALFDRGLSGSSLEDDQYNLLDRTYKQGLLDLGAKADAAKADLMGNDEGTRLGLLQSLDSGMDQGSAVNSALSQMKVNSEKAAATQIGANISDLFAGSGALYTQNKMNQASERARQDWRASNAGLFNTGGGGVVTSTGGR